MEILPFAAVLVAFLFIQTDPAESTTGTLSPSPTITATMANESTSIHANTSTTVNKTVLHSSTTSPSISPTSTSHSVTPSTSPSPVPPTTAAPTKPPSPHDQDKKRSFDGASFFGGIVLGIILAVIFVLGFTWWKNKRKSYHTL